MVAVYVDDIILTRNDLAGINALKSHLHSVFSINDLGHLNFFLRLEVTHTPHGIILSQQKFTSELLRYSDISHFKRVVTPFPINLKLHASQMNLLPDPSQYRSLVGKINFLTHTCPDLSYTVQTLSEYMQSTAGQGILLKGSDNIQLHACSNSDWGACLDTRSSVTGYIMMLGNSPMSWKFKKQNIVSKSSSEVEYCAMSAIASEITWLVRLLEELGVSQLQLVTLHCDNKSAIHIATNPVLHDCTKHVAIDCHFTREKVMAGVDQLS